MTQRFQVEIQAAHIRALSHLAAVGDLRFYLNGVMLQASPETLLIATNGVLLGCLRTKQIASGVFEVLIPNATIKQMGKIKGPVEVGSDDGVNWTIRAGAMLLGWKAEGGVFPDFRRVLPTKTTGEAAQFDARQVVQFWKAAKELDALQADTHSVLLGHNGAGAATVTLPGEPSFAGALMPLNAGDKFPKPQTAAPDWARGAPYIPGDWSPRQPEACDLT